MSALQREGIASLEVVHHKNLTAKTRKRVAVLEYVRALEREIRRLDAEISRALGRESAEEILYPPPPPTPVLRMEAPLTPPPPPKKKGPPIAHYSSDTTDFQKCPVTSKRMFRTPNLAKKVSRNLSNRFRTYKCEHCGHYHITSQV